MTPQALDCKIARLFGWKIDERRTMHNELGDIVWLKCPQDELAWYQAWVANKVPHYSSDLNAAWSLFEGDNIQLQLSTYPDGRVSASFWDKVWFTEVAENAALAVVLAWQARATWRKTNESTVR